MQDTTPQPKAQAPTGPKAGPKAPKPFVVVPYAYIERIEGVYRMEYGDDALLEVAREAGMKAPVTPDEDWSTGWSKR